MWKSYVCALPKSGLWIVWLIKSSLTRCLPYVEASSVPVCCTAFTNTTVLNRVGSELGLLINSLDSLRFLRFASVAFLSTFYHFFSGSCCSEVADCMLTTHLDISAWKLLLISKAPTLLIIFNAGVEQYFHSFIPLIPMPVGVVGMLREGELLPMLRRKS